jgi:protein SCO1/2
LRVTADVPVGPEPRTVVAYDDRAYVGGAAITVIDTSTNTVLRTIATPAADVALIDKDTVLVTNPGEGSAAVITDDGAITEMAKVGARPGGVAVDGRRAYVANGPSNDISIVDTARHRVIGRIATGNDPTSVVVAAQPRNESALPYLGRVPSFTFVDHDGHALASADLRGHPWIANFIFTRCPTACPLYTERMATLHHALPALRLVSFSVDPDFDTPERLRDFARRHHALVPAWSFVTGPLDAIRVAVADGFKVPLSRDEEQRRQGNIFHGAQAVLVDGGGAIRGYYALSDSDVAKKIAADVARVGGAGDHVSNSGCDWLGRCGVDRRLWW